MRFHFLTASAAMLAIAATVAFSPAHAGTISFDISKIEQATQVDLAAAKADADAHGDVFASQCYKGVSDFIAKNAGSAGAIITAPQGVASAFQQGRDIVKAVQSGAATGAVPPELVGACGPLALDVQNDIGKAAVGGFSLFGLKF